MDKYMGIQHMRVSLDIMLDFKEGDQGSQDKATEIMDILLDALYDIVAAANEIYPEHDAGIENIHSNKHYDGL